MKYGFKDYTLYNINKSGSKFNNAVQLFNADGFQSMMKRKSVYDDEIEMFEALKEMVAMMEEHINEVRN